MSSEIPSDRLPSKLRIAVTGFGLVSAAGLGAEALWDAFKAQRSHLSELTQIETAGLAMARGGEVQRDILPGDPQDDRALRMALHAVEEALDRAQVGSKQKNSSLRVGLALGTALGSIETLEDIITEKKNSEAWDHATPYGMTQEVSRRLGLQGPNWTFSVTCVSGLYALEQALADLYFDRSDAVVVGGLDTLSQFMQSGFCSLRALSPTGDLRPFDSEHDGIVLGEGAACVVVEPLDKALKRNAPIFGILEGNCLRSDASHLTSPDATGKGMAEAIEGALAHSQLKESDIGCISPTATGSPIYDKMQSRAVIQALKESGSTIPVTTWEPVTGHALASTGILGLVHAALVLKEKEVLPAFGLGDLAEGCDLNYILNEGQAFNGEAVLALTVGFGGQNGVSVLREFREGLHP